jgi:diaminopimelate epimerase
VILACTPDIEGVSDIAARFLEADGTEAELCGNGTGCFMHWIVQEKFVATQSPKVLTPAGVVRGSDSDGLYIRVCIPDPEDLAEDLQLETRDRRWSYDYVVTGVPHAIVYVDDVEQTDVSHWGPLIRHHPKFAPRGVNANFVQVLGPGELAVRTWEFGVEGETLACGTGSSSAAILSAMRFDWPKEYSRGEAAVRVRVRSGDILRVFFTRHEDGAITDVCLETVVRYLCRGTVHPDLVERALCQCEQLAGEQA